MKGRTSSLVSTATWAAFMILLALNPLRSQQNVVDRIVAVVDKEIVTESDVQERITYAALQNRLDPKAPELRRQVMENLIAEKLMLAQAILDSVVVTEEEVSKALDQQFQNFVRQAGSEPQLEKIYGKPISRMKREFRPEMRKQMLIQRLRQQREANLSVARREVEEFYESYKDSLPKVPEEVELSHIFIVPKADTSLENITRTHLNALRDSIVAGGDFADFARRYSQDANGANGGDLGWAKRGLAFVPEFEEAVFALKEKEISPVVKTEFGFHLIQLLERRGESVHARHILLRTEKGPASDSAAIHLLSALRDSIIQGKSLAEYARKYSEDDDTKSIGGDLGQISVDQLEPDFSSVVKNLKAGEISQPHRVALKNSYGYQIVFLKKRVAGHSANLTDDFRRVEQMALYVKRNKINAEWIEELKKNIYYDVRTQQ
jgi:peptidyl-prolyl cis-trans isomerase SurA